VFRAGSYKRFSDAIEGLERLKPGFCDRYDIYAYDDVMYLPDAVFRRFHQVMAGIGHASKLFDRAGIPKRDLHGRELSFWDRFVVAVGNL
jgi:hypothetical protein